MQVAHCYITIKHWKPCIEVEYCLFCLFLDKQVSNAFRSYYTLSPLFLLTRSSSQIHIPLFSFTWKPAGFTQSYLSWGMVSSLKTVISSLPAAWDCQVLPRAGWHEPHPHVWLSIYGSSSVLTFMRTMTMSCSAFALSVASSVMHPEPGSRWFEYPVEGWE